MDLTRYALAAGGEQIHVSVWPGISAVTNDPNYEIFDAVAECACRHHAVAAQSFVICVMTPVAQDSIDRLGFTGRPEMMTTGGGWTAIIGPNGQIIAGPHTGEEEKLLVADIDLEQIKFAKMACDSVGHYSRPDIFTLQINREKQQNTVDL
jgi:aliphatic nitrilase